MHRYGFTRVQRPAPATLRPPPQGNIEFSAQGDEAVRLSGGDRHRQASILQIGDERARKCWSPEDCALRADSKLGSSSAWPKGNGNVTIGGLVNRCCFCTKFCRFRRVYLKSCDGHSFAGNATIAAPENRPSNVPATLHSMGRAILRAVVSELVARSGLLDAKSVLVAG